MDIGRKNEGIEGGMKNKYHKEPKYQRFEDWLKTTLKQSKKSHLIAQNDDDYDREQYENGWCDAMQNILNNWRDFTHKTFIYTKEENKQ